MHYGSALKDSGVESLNDGVALSQQTVNLASQTDRACGLILESVAHTQQLADDGTVHEQSSISEQISQQMTVLRGSASDTFNHHSSKLARHTENLALLTHHFNDSLGR